MPLTYAGEVDAEQEATEKQAHARKIKPHPANWRYSIHRHGKRFPAQMVARRRVAGSEISFQF